MRRASREGTSSGVGKHGRKAPLALVVCAAVLLVSAIIVALGQVTARGDGQPRATATPDPRASQQGGVRVCLLSRYDASTVHCLSNTDTIAITGEGTDQIVWPVPQSGTAGETIQVLQQGGTGTWQIIGNAAPNALAAHSADGSLQSEAVQTLFADAGLVPNCNARYLIRVVDSHNRQFGQAPLTTTC